MCGSHGVGVSLGDLDGKEGRRNLRDEVDA